MTISLKINQKKIQVKTNYYCFFSTLDVILIIYYKLLNLEKTSPYFYINCKNLKTYKKGTTFLNYLYF